ncbi:MAG: bifunctional metallophosphatase/5'-nucleotidase [bacterium]
MNFLFFVLTYFFFAAEVQAQSSPKSLTIIHTNDLQSRLLGFGPNRDFTPETTGDDATVGGIARLATVIKNLKEKSPEATVVIDGGDFLMGTLFHTIAREEGAELRLMHAIGYDAVTLGNHEFDFRSDGLAKTIRTALTKGGVPPLLLANAVFSEADSRDDELHELFKTGIVKAYRVYERNGLKIGIFGLLGKDAAEVSPFAAPIQFADPIATARQVVKKLLEEEKVDLIVCASHGGVWRESDQGDWQGEDVDLASRVPEIDVIVGGHSHTLLTQPVRVHDTLVLQAGSEGQYAGVLDLEIVDQRVGMKEYRIMKIDDTIPADPAVQAEVERYDQIINQNILSPYGLTFDQILAETSFDMCIVEDNSNLGNLVSDAIRWNIDRYQYDPQRPHTRTVLAVESNGMIRDDILKGRSGLLQASDLFRVVPLGIGMVDDTPGYPLVSFYLAAPEIKRALEVLTSLYPIKGSSYYLQPSGLKFEYNPRRILFDRVMSIQVENEAGAWQPLDISARNHKLYKVGCNFYVATFIKIVGGFTYGLLHIVPKDSTGKPVEDLKSALVDADSGKTGVQEVKEWETLLAYTRSFHDEDHDGIPEIPEKYRHAQPRITSISSWNPALLYQNATYIMWGSTTGVGILIFLVALLVRFVATARNRAVRKVS